MKPLPFPRDVLLRGILPSGASQENHESVSSEEQDWQERGTW
jgi:hypothetical protein